MVGHSRTAPKERAGECLSRVHCASGTQTHMIPSLSRLLQTAGLFAALIHHRVGSNRDAASLNRLNAKRAKPCPVIDAPSVARPPAARHGHLQGGQALLELHRQDLSRCGEAGCVPIATSPRIPSSTALTLSFSAAVVPAVADFDDPNIDNDADLLGASLVRLVHTHMGN